MLFLTLIGAIGLFLYGMKLMSEGLQKIAGDSLRKVLAAMTRNRCTGMLTGILVTALVQSSTATTVMVVSFVNAGLVTLQEAMAVIMGANVGTTATTWLIAWLGFRCDLFFLVLPIIALSLPFFNSRKSKNNSWGEFLLGLALLFLGIQTLQTAMPEHASRTSLLYDLSYCSLPLYLVLGIVFTVLVQASSATFVLVLTLCASGWISFPISCSIVLGSNLGTCLTPLLASVKANMMAKRAAWGHILFNLIGLLWALPLFFWICPLITQMCHCIEEECLDYTASVALGLAIFHITFNVVTMLLLLPFTRQLAQFISRFISDRDEKEEPFKLQFLSKGLIGNTGEITLLQVQREVARYADETYRMLRLVQAMVDERMGSDKQLEMMDRVRRMEEESDRAELEIAQFLNQISPTTLSLSGEQRSRSLYKIVDELESIADSLFHFSATLQQKSEQCIRFSDQMNANLGKMLNLTDASLTHMLKVLNADAPPSNSLDRAYNFEDEINNLRSQLRNEMLDSVELRQIEYQQRTYFMLLINECERIGDYVVNVVAAASEK